LAQINLSYETPDGRRLSHPRVTAVLPPDLDPDAESGYFETPNTQRGVLLLNTALLMKSACADIYRSYDGYYGYYYGSRDDFDLAIARLSEFLPYFDSLADGLEDRLAPNSRSLSEERALLAQLLANLREIQ